MPFLGFILAFIFWTIAAVLGIVLLFLILPMSLGGRGRVWLSEDGDLSFGWDLDGTVRVLGGALGVDGSSGDGAKIRFLGFGFPVGKGTRRPVDKTGGGDTQKAKSQPKRKFRRTGTQKQKAAPEKKQNARFSVSKEWLRAPVRRRAIRCVRGMLRAIRRQAWVSVRCGLSDPAETGMMSAAYATWSGTTGQRWLKFTPCFTETVVDVEIRGVLRLSLARLSWIAGSFLLGRDVRPLWWRKGEGKEREAPVVGARQTG